MKEAGGETYSDRTRRERFFEVAVDAFCVVGFDGRLREVNGAYAGIVGGTAGDHVGKLWWDHVHPDDVDATRRLTQSFDEGATKTITFESRCRSKMGGYRELLWTVTPFPGERAIYAMAHDLTERRANEALIRESEAQYRALFESSPFPKWVFSPETLRFLAVNQAAVDTYGYSRDEFLAMSLDDVRPEAEVAKFHGLLPLILRGECQESLWRHRRKDGTTFEVRITSQPRPLTVRGQPGILVVVENVSPQRKLEEQLRQSQKMEAIGSLAGGIAHDFNNLLSVILSYAAMAQDDRPPGDPLRADLEEIGKAAARATELTRQLLAFSRRQVLQPRVVDMNHILGEMEKMLRRLVQEDVDVAVLPEAKLGRIQVDPSQLEQVILNLAVNARDAMPRGGTLTLATKNVEVEAGDAYHAAGVAVGPHVVLTVRDTGVGVDPAARAHIFEPFFTTKEEGKGTGFGLSTVLGIVEQSGGHITVDSEVGRGTTFTIFFPRTDKPAAPSTEQSNPGTDLEGTETVLLVEDDDQVRDLVTTVLRRRGYEVCATVNAGEALLFCEQHRGPIHLLLTDVVMRRMSGAQLAERLAPVRPDMRVLFMSGYGGEPAAGGGVPSGLPFLQKPITPNALLVKIREVLGARVSQSGVTAVRDAVASRKATILVVDDDEATRGVVRRMLGSTGAQVLEASDVDAAMALAASQSSAIDLLVTDVVLPRLDGHALARRLRELHPDVRVLFMSGHGLDVVARHGIAPEDDFLPKPFTSQTLRERVGRALAGSKTAVA